MKCFIYFNIFLLALNCYLIGLPGDNPAIAYVAVTLLSVSIIHMVENLLVAAS